MARNRRGGRSAKRQFISAVRREAPAPPRPMGEGGKKQEARSARRARQGLRNSITRSEPARGNGEACPHERGLYSFDCSFGSLTMCACGTDVVPNRHTGESRYPGAEVPSAPPQDLDPGSRAGSSPRPAHHSGRRLSGMTRVGRTVSWPHGSRQTLRVFLTMRVDVAASGNGSPRPEGAEGPSRRARPEALSLREAGRWASAALCRHGPPGRRGRARHRSRRARIRPRPARRGRRA